jgi:hypothetical protein
MLNISSRIDSLVARPSYIASPVIFAVIEASETAPNASVDICPTTKMVTSEKLYYLKLSYLRECLFLTKAYLKQVGKSQWKRVFEQQSGLFCKRSMRLNKSQDWLDLSRFDIRVIAERFAIILQGRKNGRRD